MSVRQGLLALLGEEPKYGYQLRAEFEERTGGSWPLNIGQVYTTLGRLERDGLVEPVAGGTAEENGQQVYRATEAGRAEVARWFVDPVPRVLPARDELAIKLALAVAQPGIDTHAMLDAQRAATMTQLQQLTRAKRDLRDATPGGTAVALVLERSIYEAESELRWLDHCASVLLRTPAPNGRVAPTGSADRADLIEENAR